MKISKFANKYDLSNDTVRYYMDLNLITPKKSGGHYNFDQKCESQIKEVIKLKKMNFSLKEIKNIFNFKRIGKLTSYQKNNYYQNLYKNKIKELESKINEFQKSKKRVEDTLTELKAKEEITSNTLGVDLSVLSLFSCSKCGQEFKLSAEKVKNNQVLEGSLNCDCGNTLDIRDGIIYNIDYKNEKEALTEEHIENYIKDTNQKFLDKSFEGLDWLQSEIKKEDLDNKVILEPGSGFGYLLRQIYNDLEGNSVYICVDYDHNKNIFLKRMLEMAAKKAKIIFITTDLAELPLRENSIDYLLDFSGISGYSFENEDFLLNSLDKYLKEEITVIASFIIYDKFGDKNTVDRKYRKNFIYKNIRNKILNLNFEIEKEYKLKKHKVKKEFGKYEDFAKIGDEISSYQLKAKRWR